MLKGLRGRLVAAVLTALLLVLLAVPAQAEDAGSIVLGIGGEPVLVSVDTEGLPGDDELIAGYIEQTFNAELPNDEAPVLRARPTIGLTGNDATVYWKLRTFVAQVASGKQTTAVLRFPITDLTGGKSSWTAAELGVSAVVSNGSITEAAENALSAKVAYDYQAVMDALLADCPYELYWYDKQYGSYHSMDGYFVANWVNGQYRLGFSEGAQVVISMIVSGDYSKSGNRGTSIMGSLPQRVSTALNRAKQVVADSSGITGAYERLMYFKNEILKLSDYNHTAAETSGYPYGDPWQLIYVFDGNANTTVTCEGYSKAFQYLCDLANIPGVTCYSVSGTFVGDVTGPHMWNLVNMDDGKVYLVDVTNCWDWDAGYRYEPFVTPCTSGSVSGGYTVDNLVSTNRYTYDADTKSTYTTAELTLSKTAYSAPSSPVLQDISAAWVSTITYKVYTGSAIKPGFYAIMGSKVLVEGVDYTVTYRNNVNKGTATVILAGIGSFTGTKTAYFEIIDPGWKKASNGSWYYFESNGSVRTNNWAKYGGKYYYFGSDGKLVLNGWVKYASKYYYIKNATPVVNGWVVYSGSYYYMNKNGNPVVNDIIYLSGHYYKFDAYGRLTAYTR